MLRKNIQKIRQDRRLLVAIIIIVIISSIVLYNTLFISVSAQYPQVAEISYKLSGGAREKAGREGRWDFEVLAEDFNYYELDIEVKVYDVQGNAKYVNVWFRYQCDANAYPCKGEQLSSWSGYAPDGESPPAVVHGPNADREWLWWQSYEADGEERAVVQVQLSIWYLGVPSSIKADNLDYYVLDITPEDTEGNKATWQYRIDNEWIPKPVDWVEEEETPWGELIGDEDVPSFEYLSFLILIPIVLIRKRRKKDE